MSQTIEAPRRVRRPAVRDADASDRPWVVIVWDDPVNLMTYVTLVLQRLFGYPRAKARS